MNICEKRHPIESIYRCCIFLVTALALSVAGTEKSYARDYVLTTGLSVSYEYYERTYEDDTTTTDDSSDVVTTTQDLTVLAEDDQYDRLRITPLIGITALSSRDEIKLRYKPSLRYDIDEEENDLDHNLEFSMMRFLTQRWRLLFSEQYVYTDNVTDTNTVSGDSTTSSDTTVSDDNGRRTYWTNGTRLNTVYTYLEDSLIDVGYSFNVLRNEEINTGGTYEDYDRHVFQAKNSHRFNSVYRLSTTGEYTRGFFKNDDSDTTATTDTAKSSNDKDLREYKATTSVEASEFQNHLLSLLYSFDGLDYDDPERPSNTIHNVVLGWKWQYSKDFNVSLGGGPSYRETDGLGDDWGGNGNFSAEYSQESYRIRLTGSKGYQRQVFTGSDEWGLLDVYTTKLDVSYTLLQDLSMGLYGSYQNIDQEEISAVTAAANADSSSSTTPDYSYTIDSFNRELYKGGISFSYSFWQYYSIRLGYDYTQQDSEKEGDSYEEHRASVTFSYEKDLFRW